jgi:restriction system protein
MLPVLRCYSDGAERSIRDAGILVSDAMGLTEADRADTIASGQAKWYNRLNWAMTYLMRAGVLNRPRRAVYQISDRGREILRQNPSVIDNNYLSRFPEFIAFLETQRTNPPTMNLPQAAAIRDLSPDERLDVAFGELQSTLAADLLDRVRASDPAFFERVVVDLLVAMGYGGTREDAAQVQGGSGDGGIDGTIKQDRLGLDMVYVQAKRWQTPVGRPELQGFAGALGGHRASKGVFVTTSTFTQQAKDFVVHSDKRIVLIDGPRLADLMIEHGIGVSPARRLIVNKIDGDYFDE